MHIAIIITHTVKEKRDLNIYRNGDANLVRSLCRPMALSFGDEVLPPPPA